VAATPGSVDIDRSRREMTQADLFAGAPHQHE
jgi:hypothetical protein